MSCYWLTLTEAGIGVYQQIKVESERDITIFTTELFYLPWVFNLLFVFSKKLAKEKHNKINPEITLQLSFLTLPGCKKGVATSYQTLDRRDNSSSWTQINKEFIILFFHPDVDCYARA